MAPHRGGGGRTVAPLLSFPPSVGPSLVAAAPVKIPRRHPIVRAFLALPLVFVFVALLFPFWAYEMSMVLNYLLVERQQKMKAFVYSAIFLWLDTFAGWSVAMCCLRGGGRVGRTQVPSNHKHTRRSPVVGRDEPGHEEESVGLLKHQPGHAEDENDGTRGSGSAVVAPATIQVKSDGRARYCRKCDPPIFKADRSHHCSSCGYCVLKMDHHCPWLFSCVGWANYKFFLLFLWYSGALGMFVASTTIYELINFVDSGPNNYDLAPMAWALVFFEGIIFGAAVGLFGLYHLYLACRNRTTIESMERPPTVLPSSSALAGSSSQESTNAGNSNNAEPLNFRPDHALSRRERWDLERVTKRLNVYDLGARHNLASVFGGWDKRWEWFVPIGWPPGDGTTFEIDHDKLLKLRQVTAEIRLGKRPAREREEGDLGRKD